MTQKTQEVGQLPTIELPARHDVPYTQYWHHIFPNILDRMGLLTESAKEHVLSLGTFVDRATHGLIRDLDISVLDNLPLDLPWQRRPSVADGIRVWDSTLGPLNQMVDGQGDMLRAAGILLERNVSGRGDSFIPVQGEPRDVYKAFTSLVTNNSFEHQRPTGNLLLAAQLVHKAGWVEADSQRQARLFGIAEEAYAKVANGSVDWRIGLMADDYRADIQYHRLSTAWRRAVQKGDTSKAMEVRREAGFHMQNDANKLNLLVKDMFYRRKFSEKQERAGVLAERMVALALRDGIYSSTINVEASPYLEVRRAFRHEDEPLTNRLKPRHSFDLVLQRYDEKGSVVSTLPVQLKWQSLAGYGERPQMEPEVEYLDGIEVVRLDSSLNLCAVSKSLAEIYDRRTKGLRIVDDRAVDLLRLKDHISPLLEAA